LEEGKEKRERERKCVSGKAERNNASGNRRREREEKEPPAYAFLFPLTFAFPPVQSVFLRRGIGALGSRMYCHSSAARIAPPIGPTQ